MYQLYSTISMGAQNLYSHVHSILKDVFFYPNTVILYTTENSLILSPEEDSTKPAQDDQHSFHLGPDGAHHSPVICREMINFINSHTFKTQGFQRMAIVITIQNMVQDERITAVFLGKGTKDPCPGRGVSSEAPGWSG